MRNKIETPRFAKRTMKQTVVEALVSLPITGDKPIARRNPTKLATTLIRPQLIVSPTPDAAVYSTAISYATKRIGSRKKPRNPHAIRI